MREGRRREVAAVVGAFAVIASVWLAGASDASAQFVPRHCGMRGGTETYGGIVVGSTVVLGRHTAWAGDTNWDGAMERFVGASAVVTQLSGVDTAGCPGVRVSLDGGTYFWRIRDVQLPMAVAPGDPLPRYCGMSAGAESYGVLRPGMRVVLGRHTAWGGDVNWAGEMERFVGALATITRLDGVDTAGCPGMRVDVDGGSYFWRVRDAQLGAVAPPMPMPVAIPTWCGMPSGGETYGPIVVGSWIVLGAHSPWNGDTNWAPEMGRFVGQRAMVTQLSGSDTAGCPGVRVNVDGGEFFWRIRDMRM
ncbi:hypothetical protein [Sandaracinus amylolyticus]|uniref:hypothetical protein n=1 Tax=Sandaracinus amylolyticus TaxID=927083 RepID=UPI001F1776A2|nr:hypothetical protein [Sandaracinus amylolyticus]UJR78658.1 Hypothetical protein I5071_6890 [Sandaracinus amylolyticus]